MKAQIIEIFFFRMNFVTTLVGIAHGLIFIPVILAYFGPNVNKALLYEQQQEATKGKDKKYISGAFESSRIPTVKLKIPGKLFF